MRSCAHLIMGVLFLIVQSNLFRVFDPLLLRQWSPSFVLPLILFVGVHEVSLGRGALVSFLLGYCTDVIGIAPIGLHAFSSVVIFLVARVVGVRLTAQTVMNQWFFTLTFAAAHSVIVLVLIAIFGRDAYVARTLYPLAIRHTVATALFAPLVFRIARYSERWTTGAVLRGESR